MQKYLTRLFQRLFKNPEPVGTYRESERSCAQDHQEIETRNEFIAVIGHELRNPLASLLNSVELMKLDKKDGSERERQLESMEERIRAMGRLLDNVFDISRIFQKKLQLKKEKIRARDCLREAAGSVEAHMQKNGHQFVVSLPDKNILIEADPLRIDQVVTNLLFNAAKYTPSGGTIHLKGAHENDQLVIRVRDTGIGLTEEEQEKIFDPYIHTEQQYSLRGGPDLDLTLTKCLVEMHGGTIEVQSDGLGRGTEFIVRLPAGVGNPPVKGQYAPLPKPTAGSTRILVVDDNADAARGMGKLLELHGHEVEIAFAGLEAVEKAAMHQPHGVLLDIGLPDIDGYEVARKLRTAGHNSILIALSGYGHDDHKKKAREAGFDFFLTKPVSITEIVQIVNSASRPTHAMKKPKEALPEKKPRRRL